MPIIEGIVFDLDGTLVDSAIDFENMRKEMNLPDGEPILEAMQRMTPEEQNRCEEILHRHEIYGAENAVPMPEVHAFIDRIHQKGLPYAILTRNRRTAAEHALKITELEADLLLTREDAPAKPDPTALIKIAEIWQVSVENLAMIGDYHFDLDAAINANAHPVLFAGNKLLADIPFAHNAEFIIQNYAETDAFFDWIEN